MSQMEVPNVGQNPKECARRDCIHVAVAPVTAGESLHAGDHVYFEDDGKAYHAYYHKHLLEKAIGIVDPFLKSEVEEGQLFWLFLYPNTITSLRHVWTHTAFKSKLSTE